MFITVSKGNNIIIIEISTAVYKRAVTDIAWTEGTLQYNESKRK